MILKFIWEGKEQTLVTRAGGLTLPDIKTYSRAWPLGVCGVGAMELTRASRRRLITHGHLIYAKGATWCSVERAVILTTDSGVGR